VNSITMLSKVGISAEIVEERKGEADVRVTPVQFEKLLALLPSTQYLRVQKGRIVASVFLPDLEKAVETNAKAPRTAANVTIKAVTQYLITAEGSTNQVTAGMWDADAGMGKISVNGVDRTVYSGKAEDYYEAPEDSESEWNPERLVFVLPLDVEQVEQDDESRVTLTSYGFTNLIRRVCSLRRRVL
jgi:hypothetical protein